MSDQCTTTLKRKSKNFLKNWNKSSDFSFRSYNKFHYQYHITIWKDSIIDR